MTSPRSWVFQNADTVVRETDKSRIAEITIYRNKDNDGAFVRLHGVSQPRAIGSDRETLLEIIDAVWDALGTGPRIVNGASGPDAGDHG